MPSKRKAITVSMKKKLAKVATALGVAAPDVAKGDGKTYEAWVLFEVADRLPRTIRVTARDHTGAATTSFRVRGGPGFLPAASAPPGQPCHFELMGPKSVAELHSSLRHQGASGDTHELDISAIDHTLGEIMRHHIGGGAVKDFSTRMGTLLGIELKEYDGKASLPKGYPRALLGVATDLYRWGWVSLGPGRRLNAYNPEGIDLYLLTTTTLGTSRALADHWDLNGHSHVGPRNAAALDEIANRLATRLS